MVDLEPLEPLLRWAGSALGPGVSVAVERGLREDGAPWLLRVDGSAAVSQAVLKAWRADGREGFAAEVASMTLAARHGLPAARLLGVLDDASVADQLAVLSTAVAGTSTIPAEVTEARLRATGAAMVAVSAVAHQPTAQLPLRTRPIPMSDFATERRLGKTPSSRLLDLADELVRAVPAPNGASVLVHADLWQGNLMWQEDQLTAIIDWEMAGVGHYGIDLAALRLDAAMLFGLPAASLVLEGWREASGTPPEALPYWDATAALNMPADMSYFLPAIHDQGRTDLTPDTLNERRDAFLRNAMAAL